MGLSSQKNGTSLAKIVVVKWSVALEFGKQFSKLWLWHEGRSVKKQMFACSKPLRWASEMPLHNNSKP